MRNFSESLCNEIEQKVELIKNKTSGDTIEYCYQAIIIIKDGLEKLRFFFTEQINIEAKDEIEFFKSIKPKLTSKLIFFNELYNIERNKPGSTSKALKKYYNKELRKREDFFSENHELYKYYNNGHQHLDNLYFSRSCQDIKFSVDSYYFNADKNFSTLYDYRIALLIANKDLQKYLMETIKILKKSECSGSSDSLSLKWTGSKVGIIELIYALHSEGVFNNGSSEIREIAYSFGKIFNVEIGQFHRTFYEICARKSERTKFLNSLKENLLKRMEQSDE
jgi:hypothetical protein